MEILTIGKLIKVARSIKGWSQRELAKRSGVNNVIIAQMESGHIEKPSFYNVVKLAKALNMSLSQFAELVE